MGSMQQLKQLISYVEYNILKLMSTKKQKPLKAIAGKRGLCRTLQINTVDMEYL